AETHRIGRDRGVRREQAQQREAGDGLARTGFADQPEYLAGRDGEAHAADRFHPLGPDREGGAQIRNLYQCGCHSRALSLGSMTSRMPSLSRLSPSKAKEIATPDS